MTGYVFSCKAVKVIETKHFNTKYVLCKINFYILLPIVPINKQGAMIQLLTS